MRRASFWVLGLVVAMLVALPVGGSSLRSDVLFLLPRESGEVAFVDLQVLRSSPHYLPIKRLVPPRFAHFERFVRSLGMDVDKDLDWLAWVLVPPGPDNPRELFLGLTQGHFAPEEVEDFYQQQDLPLHTYSGQTLFPFGSGVGSRDLFFAFLDSSTAVFGTRPSLELLLETRFGAHENLLHNEPLLARLNEINGNAPVWVVLDEYYTRLAVRQLIPEAVKFEQFSQAAARFRAALLHLELDRDMMLHFEAWCAAPQDAQVLSLLLETGLAAQSWQIKETHPVLSTVLGHTEVRTAGERLELRVAIEAQELEALLARGRPRF